MRRLLATAALPLALAACDDAPVQVILVDARTPIGGAGGGGAGGAGGGPTQPGDAGAVPSLQSCAMPARALSLGRSVPALAAGGGRLYVAADGQLTAFDVLAVEDCALMLAAGFVPPLLPAAALPQLAATADGRLVVRDGTDVRLFDRDGREELVCALEPTTSLAGFADFDGQYVQGVSARGKVERVELNRLCVPTDDELTPAPAAGAYLVQSAVDFHLVVEPSLAGEPTVVRYGGENFERLATYEGAEPAGVICAGLPAPVLCHASDVCVLDPSCSAVRRFSFDGAPKGRLDLAGRGLQVLAVAAETNEPYGWALAAQGDGEPTLLRLGK